MPDKPSTDKPSTVPVEIFGQTYTVKAGADPGYVEQLAAYVDVQMREVSRSAGAVDSVRVAVLAALNIADECFRLRGEAKEAARQAAQKAEDKARSRAEDLARKLGAALSEGE